MFNVQSSMFNGSVFSFMKQTYNHKTGEPCNNR